MANTLFNGNASKVANDPISMMSAFIDNGGNPQQAMQMLMSKNPKSQRMMQQLQMMSKGRNPKDLALEMAKQKGIDPNAVMNLANKMGLK